MLAAAEFTKCAMDDAIVRRFSSTDERFAVERCGVHTIEKMHYDHTTQNTGIPATRSGQ